MINGKTGSFGPYPSQNTSLLLEKAKSNMRRSTPDSDALASSDDEQDHSQRSITTPSQQTPRSTRRPSWLSETRPPVTRKTSGTGLESLSSNSPHSSTEASTWSTGTSAGTRGHTGSASLPWNNAIWANDHQKGLPARFAEVLPSPTSLNHPAPIGSEQPLKSPSPRRDSMSEGAIPFAIPLHPTLKTYRSQSYSVGQMDAEAGGQATARPGPQSYVGRTRAGSSYAGLHNRPSRPSVLGEFSAESSGLGQVQEVEDDEESATSSDAGLRFANSQARTIEQLAMENAILRQQAMANQSASAQAALGTYGMGASGLSRGHRGMPISESVLEESDDQLAGAEDQRPGSNAGSASGRQHRFNGSQEALHSASPEQLEAVPITRSPASYKRGHWQTSLGFGGLGEAPQSRRHSFADMPLRSMPLNIAQEAANKQAELHQGLTSFGNVATNAHAENASYFTNPLSRYSELRSSPGSHPQHVVHQQRMQYFGQPKMHQPQSLYLVTFKAARAEFYYVQEGTGLEVNEGDLVIVEADRGTDLGTVAHKNVDWSLAKELKEQYVAEHYNWLMMFSRQGQNGMAQSALRPTSSGNPNSKSPIGGGLSPQGSSAVDSLASEIKPKMIKRLALQHEIHTLREKEGNEAKAKRMCQQKVAEHHLNMEILDAEFQMDWKKLTFYYFADSYINFNSLVTDLFKIYKTRIWMSAINPASFVSPSAGLSSHIGAGYGAVGPDREQYGKQDHGYAGQATQDSSYDSNWPSSGNSIPGSAPLGYAHFWPSQGFQQMQSMNGMRGQGIRDTPSPNRRLGARDTSSPQSQGNYGDSVLSSNYLDQVQALQGLSLGGN